LKRSIAKEKAQRLAAEEEKRLAELARKHAEEEKRRQEKLAAERAEEAKRLAELARKHAEEEKRRQEKLAAERAEEEKRQKELARKRAEEEKRRQEKLQKEKELAEKEKSAYDGKLLFSIVRAEDLLVDDIEKDDTGKIVSVDIQVGCSYGLKITVFFNWGQNCNLASSLKLTSVIRELPLQGGLVRGGQLLRRKMSGRN
jgi:hypothetical protein